LGNASRKLEKTLGKIKMNDSKDTSRNTAASDRDLTLTRVFKAPREIIWKAWTNSRHLAQWLGLLRFTNAVCEIDVHPAGAIRIHVRAPVSNANEKAAPYLAGMEAGCTQSLERLDSWIVKNIDGNSVLQRSLRTTEGG
jgi:hypothetical protein